MAFKRMEGFTGSVPQKFIDNRVPKCPMCGTSMYVDKTLWTTQDGVQHERIRYQCGHYAKAKHGQCKKNAILAEWVEAEVIGYTKLLVRNQEFARDIQAQIGRKVDSSEIDAEIERYQKTLQKLERSKVNLERDIDGISEDDKNAERKRQDMNRRLDKLYGEIYDVEDQIAACEQRKAFVEENILTQENIYRTLLVFDEFFDKMSKEDKRRVLESLIAECSFIQRKHGKRVKAL